MKPGRKSETLTIHDVARAAGVSIKTVSRVLNKEPKVRAATAEKVMKVVEELDYRPNLSARTLRSDRSFLLGLIYDNPSVSYISAIELGAHKRCRHYGYHLLVEPIDSADPDLEESINTLVVKSKLDGIILTPPICDNEPILSALRNNEIPFAQIAPGEPSEKDFYVYMDDEKAAYEMTAYLISLGHRDIGIIKGDTQQSASHERYLGFKRALEEHGIPLNERYVQQGYFTYRSGIQCAEALLTLEHPPSAIFVSNDDMAIAAASVANKYNINVPEDLSITGFDDIHFASGIWPSLTTIRQPISQMAGAAVDLLLNNAMASNPGDGEITHVKQLDFELMIRESTAPPMAHRDE